MKEEWLEILEWIQLALTLLFLLIMLGVLALVIRYHKLEFNGLWKTRAALVWIAFMWGISLLLGRHHLWAKDDGALSTSVGNFKRLCRAHVFLTFGVFQPLFFLIILMILKSKERSKLLLYNLDPNQRVMLRAAMWCVPLVIVHIVILALSGVHEGADVVWATYTNEHQHCVVPILSTAPFAVFYGLFLLFYLLSSRRLFKQMINRTLRFRIRSTQIFFLIVFPLEICLRFISIFISKYHDAYESIYHTYYFLELIVCTGTIIELVLMPVLDAVSFPLLAGVTASACQEYSKSEEEKKQRRYTRSHNALERVKSEDELEKGRNNSGGSSSNNNSPSSSSSSNKYKVEMEPLQKKPSLTGSAGSLSPSSEVASNKPLLSPPLSTSNDSIPDHDNNPSVNSINSISTINTANTFSSLNNLNVTLTAAGGGYPDDLDVDDVFADIDDDAPAEDSSLKLKVDGLFLKDDH